MKFYTIAMMVFLISLSVAILQRVDVMSYNQVYQADYISSIEDTRYQNQTYESSLVNSANTGSDIFGDFRIAITIFGKSLFYATFGLPFMFHSFGLDWALSLLFALPIWIVYGVAFMQLLLRTPFEGMK